MSDPCTCSWQAPHGDACPAGDVEPFVRVPHPHVETRPDVLSGSPVIRGTRVPVRRIWMWHRKGVTVETLIKRYPQLGPAKVLDALAFSYDNQPVIEKDIERERLMLDDQAADDRSKADG